MTASVGRIWNPGVMSSVRMDWATPWRILKMLSAEFNFALDACATPETAVCKNFFSPPFQDALSDSWDVFDGSAVWCNPPYGRAIGKWVEKAYRESGHGNTVVMLLPARTDTQWWHDYCMKGEIRFLRGRLNFDDTRRARAPFPSAIVIFRPGSSR